MQDNNLATLAALATLNKMMKSSSVNICSIDQIGEMLGISVKNSKSYNILRTVHCVDFDLMAPELRKAIPQLIQDCLTQDVVFQFDGKSFYTMKSLEDNPTIRKEKGWLTGNAN